MENEWSRLEKLIHGSIEKTLTSSSSEVASIETIARQLTEEISSSARLDKKGRSYAPDQYTLSLNPLDYEYLRKIAPKTQWELSAALLIAFQASELSYLQKPQITLATDPTLSREEIRVIAWHSSDPLLFNNELDDEQSSSSVEAPVGAFLIIEGKRHFPLGENIVQIGRRLDNHLILEDRHVSRAHARLEVVSGRYRIVDLDSTAGTRVNGRLINRHTLRPGDIISIAAVQLIYGEDPQGPPEVTPPYKPQVDKGPQRDQVTPLNLEATHIKPTAPYNKGKP
ncbi:MAG: DUF3662 domain-containing protein [Chloroflexi bacterium]|nr:DUF3662 domain-containing protein [Chloroflexota bacterium]